MKIRSSIRALAAAATVAWRRRWRWPAARWTTPERTPTSRRMRTGIPDVPQWRPHRQEQQVARGGAARLQHQVDQVRLRRRRQHRVHRQGTGLRRAGLQPGGPRPVRPAEHPLQRRLRARRRRRQRGPGGPQRLGRQLDRRAEGQAHRHPVRVDGALQPARRVGSERTCRPRTFS